MKSAQSAVVSSLPALLMTAACGLAQDRIDDTQAAVAGPSFLLLDNGAVLQGRIEPEGDRLRVSSEGRVLHIAARRVQSHAGGLRPLYRWQRDRLAAGDARGRLRLAEWCLRHHLWPEAWAEALAARRLGAPEGTVAVFKRRLAEASRPAPAAASETAEAALRERHQAKAAEAAQQLAMVRTLPDGALVEFTRRIQPILVNSCTTSGCHQTGGEESFQLNRQWVHGVADRRSTLANLATVLTAIDRSRPDQSAVLRAMTEAHAGLPEGAVAKREDLVARVRQWTYAVAAASGAETTRAPRRRYGPAVSPAYSGLIAGGFSPAAPVQRGQTFDPAAFGRGTATLGGDAPPGTGAVATAAARVASRRTQSYQDPALTPASFEAAAPTGAEGAKPAASATRGAGRDEFDPAEFNRRRASTLSGDAEPGR